MNAGFWITVNVLLVLVGGLTINHFRGRWEALDQQPKYRTANKGAIARDTTRLQRRVPDPAYRRVGCSMDCNQGRACTCARRPAAPGNVVSLQQSYRERAAMVSRDAETAAISDALTGRTTPNPHRRNSRAHVLWTTTYGAKLLQQQDQAGA